MDIIRLQSLRCIILVTLAILIAGVSLFFIFFWQHENEIPDPEFPPPPSSMPMGVYKSVGVVANGKLCAQIGVDAIARGGNAVDAAIATMLCDGVLTPQYMGLGGGFIMSIYNATTKKVISVNARETAPAAATTDMFEKKPLSSEIGGMAAAIPGSLKGYSKIYHLYGGGVTWESLFKPTVQLCENGMEISKLLEKAMKMSELLLKTDKMLRETFFDETTGNLKKAGEIYKLPKLAETLKVLAKDGVNALYNGSLTSRFIEDLKTIGGIMSKEDLAKYEVEIEESFTVNLKNGYKIHAGSPPGSGIILAYILRILDGMLPAPNAGLDAHRLVEAFKFGYGERTHLGDHKFVDVSEIYKKVNSDSHIESVRRKIFDNFTSLDPGYYGADYGVPMDHGTANMVVTDSIGNTVVATSTINTYFGCGFMSPSTGIIVNNEMDDFSTPGTINAYGFRPSPANFIQPGKRPLSSMCPTVITDKNGDLVLGLGAAGGSKITLATAYVTAHKLWLNKTLKESVDRPRIYHQLIPMEVDYEYGITKDVVQKLKDIGHPMKRLKQNIGSAVTAIFKTSSGMLEAMADYRRPGISSGY